MPETNEFAIVANDAVPINVLIVVMPDTFEYATFDAVIA